jgi:aminoglycoside/choline kinase family phosphotransferase
MDQRLAQLSHWINQQLSHTKLYQGPSLPLSMVSGDASFRRYFRCLYASNLGLGSVICVDAPPDKEKAPAFVKVAQGFAAASVPVPQILAVDLQQGFMMLSDMGDCLLKTVLNKDTAQHYIPQALDALRDIMAADFSVDPLPDYGPALLQREMELFREWFCGRFLQLSLSDDEQGLLSEIFAYLEQQALQQDQAPVHRDYHTRNLMVLEDGGLGIIDFQDAVMGPVTYDVMSLLRDETFPSWDQALVKQWALQFADTLRQGGVTQADNQRFWHGFNAIGAQRHLKVAGIFARLHYRDQKQGYLQHTPQSLQYLLMEMQSLEGSAPEVVAQFRQWLLRRVLPPVVEKFPDSEALFDAATGQGQW